jgi:hypothetical protein
MGWSFNWASVLLWRHQPTIKLFSGAVAGEEVEDFCKESFRTHILYFVYLFCFTLFIFTCIVLSKTQKNQNPL